ncbi:hypothetical protein [Herbidospora daliensis]|uniref:hypothetical protein n=1 Tax=Herbidospora daliensis TaxID=295585 RepID=UPI000A56E7BB|nr:hypothetical protein [Herbidospora daliensis]
METIGVLLFVLIVIAVFYRATVSNPLKRCGRCKGKGTIPSTVLSGRYRVCPRCTRKGEVRAWGGGSE